VSSYADAIVELAAACDDVLAPAHPAEMVAVG
jgi:hypothetical protein